MNKLVDSLVSKLTLEEKIRICAGKGFWHTVDIARLGIPSIKMNDGPHGVRATESPDIIVTDNEGATCFPTASALASSWDESLIAEVADAIALEASHHGVHLLLGPGVNLKRSPLGGRNFEYFSEDPYLTSTLATAYVAGLQARGVGACLKHFLCNEQETERMTIDCVVDKRAIHEVYTQPFAACIKEEKPAAIMLAYNKINGENISESQAIVKDLLRKSLGFQGVVISDWGAVDDGFKAMEATVDLDMPQMGSSQFDSLLALYQQGRINENQLNSRVRRILSMVIKLAQSSKKTEINFAAHFQIARKAAQASIVLLKNDLKLLPLPLTLDAIGVVGSLFKKPRIQGGGSSKVLSHHTVTPADALAQRIPGLKVDFAPGYMVNASVIDDDLTAEALEVVRRNEVNLLFLGLLEHEETEGKDRICYTLSQQQQQLVETLLNVDPHLIVILNNGTAVTFSAIDRVQTLVESWLLGSAMGEALIDVLFGQVNPSGKLSETFPLHQQDFPLGTRKKSSHNQIQYSESILVGHRYYDYKGLPVAFPFGHGLSYTEFAYHNLTLTAAKMTADQTVNVTFDIQNVGSRAGKEVAQLYIEHLNPDILKPPKTLRKFKKVDLQPGQKTAVTFQLNQEDFQYYHDRFERFFVDRGKYNIHIGRSSRDIILTQPIEIINSEEINNFIITRLDKYSIGKDFLATEHSKKIFEQIFGFLKDTDLYDIILDMPLNSLHRLFPQLISRQQIEELLDRLKE